MESFEAFVAVALETEGLVVSEAVKFPVKRRTKKAKYAEFQTHGFEVDLVAARSDRLVLATVKSFFGSRGVFADQVMGLPGADGTRYALLNDQEVRSQVIAGAANTYGYPEDRVHVRLYVGKFAAPKAGTHEQRIREWCATQYLGAGPIEVIGLKDVVAAVSRAAAHKQYRDNPVLVTMKVLEAAGLLKLELPEDIGDGEA